MPSGFTNIWVSAIDIEADAATENLAFGFAQPSALAAPGDMEDFGFDNDEAAAQRQMPK